MRALSPKLLRELRGLLAALDFQTGGHMPAQRFIAAIDAALRPKKSAAPARKRRTQKAKTRKEEWADVREQVLKRADGKCENPLCRGGIADQADHFLGGNGRRRALQSVFTCWGLCWECHLAKTRNLPTPSYWLSRFIEHCEAWADAADGNDHIEDRQSFRDAAAMARNRLAALELQARATP